MKSYGLWLFALGTLAAPLLSSCAPHRGGVQVAHAAGIQYTVTDRVALSGMKDTAVYRYSFLGPYVRRDFLSGGSGNSSDRSEIADCSRRTEALILTDGRVVRNLALPARPARTLPMRGPDALSLNGARPLGHRIIAGVPADGYRRRVGRGTIETWFATGIRRPSLNVLCEGTMPQHGTGSRRTDRLVLLVDQRSPSGEVTRRVSDIKPLTSKDLDLFAPVLR